jgi:hypothetical protein
MAKQYMFDFSNFFCNHPKRKKAEGGKIERGWQ